MFTFDDIYHLQLVLIWSLSFLSVNLALLKFYPVPKSVYHALDQRKENVVFAEFVAYFSSFINAVICFFVGLSIILENGLQLTGTNKWNETLLVSFTIGYFVCDTVTGLVYEYNRTLMNLHHLVIILAGIYVLHLGIFGNPMVITLVISELSNVFRTVEMITDKYPEQKHISFVFGICFAVTFIFCR